MAKDITRSRSPTVSTTMISAFWPKLDLDELTEGSDILDRMSRSTSIGCRFDQLDQDSDDDRQDPSRRTGADRNHPGRRRPLGGELGLRAHRLRRVHHRTRLAVAENLADCVAPAAGARRQRHGHGRGFRSLRFADSLGPRQGWPLDRHRRRALPASSHEQVSTWPSRARHRSRRGLVGELQFQLDAAHGADRDGPAQQYDELLARGARRRYPRTARGRWFWAQGARLAQSPERRGPVPGQRRNSSEDPPLHAGSDADERYHRPARLGLRHARRLTACGGMGLHRLCSQLHPLPGARWSRQCSRPYSP